MKAEFKSNGLIHKLIHVTDADPGIYRKRRGRGFVYVDEQGKKITAKAVCRRISQIKIPPMWQEVWICRSPNGHIQATGKDAKGRKQYIYHEAWSKYHNTHKFERMPDFVRALPEIREQSAKDLRQREWRKSKILGLVVRLLDDLYIRIGNNCYKDQNNTYGLTTLRRKHLIADGKRVTFQYRAKSGKERRVHVVNKQLARLIRECSELPGYELFRYIDEEGKYQPVDSQDVNEYIRSITGGTFSSKDFRTWGGTVLAIKMVEKAMGKVEENPRLALMPTLVAEVARELGNTRAVCRDYYIHPAVLEAIEAGTVADFRKNIGNKYRKLSDVLEPNELIALNIIESSH